jgi:hypothetical protein
MHDNIIPVKTPQYIFTFGGMLYPIAKTFPPKTDSSRAVCLSLFHAIFTKGVYDWYNIMVYEEKERENRKGGTVYARST